MKKVIITGILFFTFTELNGMTNGTGKKQMYNEVRKIVHSIYPKTKNITWHCRSINQYSLAGITTIYYGCIVKSNYGKKIGLECEEKYMKMSGSTTNCKFTRYIK